MVDGALLERARGAGARLAEAERQTLLARADYHTAIRRLHLAGAPLREIARELSLSHQRVQQIVQAAGGSWWDVWRRRPTPDAVCRWCDRPPSEVDKLIAGPKVYICDACVAAVEPIAAGESGRGDLARVAHRARQRCSFCRKRAADGRPLVTGPANICGDCLRVCREILESRGE